MHIVHRNLATGIVDFHQLRSQWEQTGFERRVAVVDLVVARRLELQEGWEW
jgi:hypothetical protein